MDTAEFERLYQRLAADIRRTILRIVRESEAADDVLQEVFIRAWNNRKSSTEIRDYRAWLTKIAVNLSLNALRSKNRKRELSLGRSPVEDDQTIQKTLADLSDPGPETVLIRNSRIETMRRLISELPPGKREVLQYVDQYDLSIQETSEKLGIPDGTVKSRLFYARRMLSEQIREIFDE